MRRCSKDDCKRWCRYCVLAVIGLPIEHFAWEHVPGGLWLLRAAGIGI